MSVPDGVRKIDGLETEEEYLAYAAIIYSSEGSLAEVADEMAHLTEVREGDKANWLETHAWLMANEAAVVRFEDWVTMAKALARVTT